MHLTTLHTTVPHKILQRGEAYYREGAIEDTRVFGDRVQATVQGTELYEVYLIRHIDEPEHILQWSCDCPYDMGDVCKHVVAVMLYLREEIEQEEGGVVDLLDEAKQPAKGSNSITQILEKVSAKELKAYLEERMFFDPNLARHFEATFSQYAPAPKGKSKAKGIIGELIRSYQARGQHGFIDRRASSALGIELVQLLESKKHQQSSDLHLFAIEAIDKGVASFEKGNDDSNGHFGDAMRFALQILEDIAAGPTLQKKERKKLFDRVLKLWLSGVPSGYGINLDDLLTTLAAPSTGMNTHLREKVEEQISQLDGDDWSASYKRRNLTMFQYRLIGRLEGEDKAKEFLYAQLEDETFKEEALLLAEEENNWAEVKRLAEEGIAQNQKKDGGFHQDWSDWLIKWAVATGDAGFELRMIEERFLDNPSMDDYHQLKEKLEANLFAQKLANWSKDFLESQSSVFKNIIPDIAIEEKKWDLLRHYLLNSYQFYSLNDYELIIPESYREDIIALYATKLDQFIDDHTGRPKYKVAARQLKRMIRLGGVSQAKFVAEEAMKRHPRRPSMKEEFEKVVGILGKG